MRDLERLEEALGQRSLVSDHLPLLQSRLAGCVLLCCCPSSLAAAAVAAAEGRLWQVLRELVLLEPASTAFAKAHTFLLRAIGIGESP
jgi:hypothetical protein